MFTITLSAGVVFGAGVVAGFALGVVGLAAFAVITNKIKKK